jgi:hypothetical protein
MERPQPQKMLAHCPLCHTAYESAEIRLLGEKGATRLFHCTCRSCGHSVLAVILETQGSVSSVGLVTDLELKDALRFKDADPITSDECIAAHRALAADSRAWCRRLLDIKA